MIRKDIDAVDLLCPMPVIQLQNCIAALAVGDQVQITATDPGVKQDIPTWCRINGHRILQQQEAIGERSDVYLFLIEVGILS